MLKRWSGSEWETINEVEVGGVNLIAGSASHAIAADSSDTYWVAADELDCGGKYIFTVEEVRLDAGTATGASWALINQNDGTLSQSSTLAFSDERQTVRF